MNIEDSNPYVGLRPYRADESLLFFGRKDQILELLQRLHNHHFVAVVGSSGSGKSSLLRAGLIPALKAGYLVADTDNWFISIMKPGQSPLYNLAKSLLLNLDQEFSVTAAQNLAIKIEEEGADAILNLLAPLQKDNNRNFFLLVDQFEELFRFSMEQNDSVKKDRAIDFVNIILELSRQNQLPFYVVLTMRSDFIGDCAEFHGLPEAMNRSQYLVPRLNRQQLKLVIENPAKLFGIKFNSALSSKLLNEMGKVKDELPLLQHTLMRMWDYEMEKDKSGDIDIKDYEAIGGIDKALSKHADEALKNSVDKNEFRIAKILFQALTTVDEHGRKTRRPVLLSELVELTGASEEQLLKVINHFIEDHRSFLIISDGIDDKIIDISHESLIRQWVRLRRWVDEEGEAASNYKKLSQDSILYNRGERGRKKDLLVGTELELASAWYKNFQPTAAWASRYNDLYDTSIQYLKDSEKEHQKRQRKKRNIKRGTNSLVILAVIAILWLYVIPTFQELQKDVINADNAWWQKATTNNTIVGYKEYLENVPNGKMRGEAEDRLRLMYDSLWDRATGLNTQDAYDEYLAQAQDSIIETLNSRGTQKEPIIIYSKYATNANEAEVARNQLLEQDSLVQANDPWQLAMRGNTIQDYLNYLIQGNTEHKEEAVKRIDNIGTRGWLFCGRTTNVRRINTDRVFDLIYREGEAPYVNSMLDSGDIVRLRPGIAHRNIRAGVGPDSPRRGVVRNDTYYYVYDTDYLFSGKSASVFVQIIFEK